MAKRSRHAEGFQGVQLPIAMPRASEKSPHAVGFGMMFAPMIAKKKSSAAMAKKIRPITEDSLKRSSPCTTDAG